MSALRTDLTRWNRAGLSRVQYVDGNAAVFLEHLRSAMIAGFSRGVPGSEDARDPDYWFDLLRDAGHPAPDAATMADYASALDWSDLALGLPVKQEGKAARNARLVSNYNGLSEDYAAETLRAFARATHVLAGYTDAYMNESYLSTATQWASLHKLGQMVNYAPVPSASAADSVALTVKPDSGSQRIKPGLAMSTPPPSGGAPLIFETLSEITTHPDLNAARERRWDVNREVLTFKDLNIWDLDGAKGPAPGAPVLIAPGKMTEPSPKALLVAQTRPGADDTTVKIAMQSEPSGKWRKGYTELWSAPEGSAYGLITSRDGQVVVRVDKTAAFKEGAVVEVKTRAASSGVFAVVDAIAGDRMALSSAQDLTEIEGLKPMAEYPITNGYVDLATDEPHAYFNYQGSPVAVGRSTTEIFWPSTSATTGTVKIYPSESDHTVAVAYRRAKPGASWAGLPDPDADWTDAQYLVHPPKITDVLNNPDATIAFQGKAPKSLTEGSYYVARLPDDTLVPLRVRGYRADKDEYFVAFNKTPSEIPENTLFFGPMKDVMRPQDHDRSTDAIVDADGWVTLAGLSDDAKDLIRKGRKVIIEDKRETAAALLTEIDKVSEEARNSVTEGERDQVKIRFTSLVSNFEPFQAGWTVFRLNTVEIGHGETKSGKVLGSGNGELFRQTLMLDVGQVSFIADPIAATGVRPDIDVRVDEDLWDYADLTDPLAEDTKTYSIRPREDGKLDIVFRRRLPTGRNNIRVSRHRVGAGSLGNGLGPYALTKPKSKHKIIDAVYQPFATAGGADRESVDSIRDSAGAALAANGRAVSLADFGRLVRRHASVWDARAAEVVHPGRAATVDVTVVPVDGATLNPALETTLADFLTARALPGTAINILPFARAHLTISATIRADLAQMVQEDLRDAAVAHLADSFGLARRKLGQPFFVAEVLAALEAMTGVETAQADLGLKSDTADRSGLTFRSTSDAIRAVTPAVSEVAFVAAATDITLTVEAL